MARWGLIPFWMKEKPKVPHIKPVLRLFISCPCSERHSLNVDASYPQLAFTSGNSEATANSRIGFVAKTSSHSPSRDMGVCPIEWRRDLICGDDCR